MNFRCIVGWCYSLVGTVKKMALRLVEPYRQDKFKAPHKNSEKGASWMFQRIKDLCYQA